MVKRKSNPTADRSIANRASLSTRKARRHVELLTIESFRPKNVGTRVLSCGEGEQIGHPGRTVTRKPRFVDTFSDGTEFVQVAAGGVHSLVLTTTGVVYSCGINEKGTVPVVGLDPEETTDIFTEIAFSKEINELGKIIQITAGASFSAALTEEGSVIAWGNLRNAQGELSDHETLNEIKKSPIIVLNHRKAGKRIVKIAAGENHLAMLSERGEILTLGEGSMGQLGRTLRLSHIRSKYMVDDTGSSLVMHVLEKGKLLFFTDVWAKGYWTIGRVDDGRIFACGLNNFGQLGVYPHYKTTFKRKRKRAEDKLSINMINNSEPMPSNGTCLDTEPMEVSSGNESVNSRKASAEDTGDEEGARIGLIAHAEAFPLSRKWTHFSGVHHVLCRDELGEVWAIGKNTDNALGLGTWANNDDKEHWRYDALQEVNLPDNEKAVGIDATLGASIVWTDSGKVYAFGCDTVGQLGLGIKDDDDKIVPTPRLVHSAHLEGYCVISASIADNHTLFLARKSA